MEFGLMSAESAADRILGVVRGLAKGTLQFCTYDHGADWPLDWRVNAVGEGAALTDIAFEPVSSNRSFRCGKRDFQGRDKEAETAQDCDRGRRRGCGKLLKRKQTVIEWGSFHMGLKRARQYDASKGG
jgi:hypothetical protein